MLLFLRIREFEFRPRWLARITNAVLVGKIHSEEKHPISRPLMKLYHPVVRAALKLRWLVIIHRHRSRRNYDSDLPASWF